MAISHTARLWKIILNTGTAGTRIEVSGHWTALNLGIESWWLELIDLRLSQEPERKGVNSQVKGV